MKYPKFIVEGDKIIFGKVKYHKDLTSFKETVHGGGWYVIKIEDRVAKIVLHSESFDFGKYKVSDVFKTLKLGSENVLMNIGCGKNVPFYNRLKNVDMVIFYDEFIDESRTIYTTIPVNNG